MIYKELIKEQQKFEKLNPVIQPIYSQIQNSTIQIALAQAQDPTTQVALAQLPQIEHMQSLVNSIQPNLIAINSMSEQFQKQLSIVIPYFTTLLSYIDISSLNQDIDTIPETINKSDKSNNTINEITIIDEIHNNQLQDTNNTANKNLSLMRNEVIKMINEYNSQPNMPEDKKIIFSEQPFFDNKKNMAYIYSLISKIISKGYQSYQAKLVIKNIVGIELPTIIEALNKIYTFITLFFK
ncbi:hypothetical protein AAK894_13465 [Lachnospiraceae bacterium 46-61]